MTELVSTAVDPAYRHVVKVAVPTGLTATGPTATGAAGALKWYDIREPHRTIDESVRADAARVVTALIEPGDTGFVLLHLCGDDFYFLLVCRWRNNNELWETVIARRGAEPFAEITGGATRATFCAWELGVVNAERMSWSAYLRSDRDEAALGAYLADAYSGEV